MTTRTATESGVAVRLFWAVFVVFAFAALLAGVLQAVFPPHRSSGGLMPAAFFITSLLLAAASAANQRALGFVRNKRQKQFRQCLAAALVSATLFLGIQCYGIICLLHRQVPQDASTGAAAFVVVFAAMHAMHVVLACLFLIYITIQAFAQRYNHEYYWGVLVCTWFWHGLGLVWLCILAVIAIAS